MRIKDLTDFLEKIAPLSYQENYDNAGLIVGDPDSLLTGVLVCLDSTEAIIEEAVRKGCNLVIAHHPIIFRGLKRLNGSNYVERTVIRAIREGVAIYAIHTNLDNVLHQGVNARIGERLGLVDTRILAPKQEMVKLSSFVPSTHQEQIKSALVKAGAEQVGFLDQSGYHHRDNGADQGLSVPYTKLEVLLPATRQKVIIKALQTNQPDQQAPFDIVRIENPNTSAGAGLIGKLPKPMTETETLQLIRRQMQTNCIRHTRLLDREVTTVALCGGSGGFLLEKAVQQGADIFISADYKYHEFFDADGRILIADIGHFESEQFTIDLLYEIISRNFRNFAAYRTEINTNPINYMC